MYRPLHTIVFRAHQNTPEGVENIPEPAVCQYTKHTTPLSGLSIRFLPAQSFKRESVEFTVRISIPFYDISSPMGDILCCINGEWTRAETVTQ